MCSHPAFFLHMYPYRNFGRFSRSDEGFHYPSHALEVDSIDLVVRRVVVLVKIRGGEGMSRNALEGKADVVTPEEQPSFGEGVRFDLKTR